MAGTHEGAKKGAKTKFKKYGKDHFAKVGALGGSSHHKGGFASKNVGKDGLTGPERARAVRLKEQEVSRENHEASA